MFKRLVSAAIIFGTVALAPPTIANAQAAQCKPRDVMVETLKSRYGEALSGGGLQSSQQLLEVWSSEDTGSFTVLLTRANGLSCVVASGQHWTEPAVKTPIGLPS